MQRPSIVLLESAYDELFHSTWDKLRDSAIHGHLFDYRKHDKLEGVPGRSIAWKLFLTRQPPLTASLSRHPVAPLYPLLHSRKRYASLLEEKMRPPDGSYEEGFNVPRETSRERFPGSQSSNAPHKSGDWTRNNPLSLDSTNPWHAYFSALDLRDTIRQDVERTFPEVPFFRVLTVQNEMTNILFLHVSERQNIGYRQGMHELLACVYHAVDFDSVEPAQGNMRAELKELCDRKYVAADAFALFGAIMESMESWYEWRPQIAPQVSPTFPVQHVPHFSANGEIVSLPNPQPQIDVLENGQLDLKPYVAPIVPTCASLRDEKLRVVDPHLWEKLQECGVEAQLYGIRWLRLLFTREFSLAESMVIWDGIFASVSEDYPSSSSSASPQGFELALWISVAMLIRTRNILIPGDYTTQLTYLLRYPTPSTLGAASNTSNAPALLLTQAQQLMTSPNPATGASIVLQNRNELGIPVEVPDPPAPSHTHRRRRGSATAPPTVPVSQSKTSHPLDRPRLQDMITNRLMDANESLGIQRGFFNTITELRKNLPDLSQTLIRSSSRNNSAISLANEDSNTSRYPRSPATIAPDIAERPPWEPKLRSEVEREMAELRALLKTLGNAVGWAVDVLLLDGETREPQEGEKSLREKKMEAVECMAYVRDVLARGGQGEIDEERLVSEEEYQRQRRLKQEKERAAAAVNQPPMPKPVPPPPRAAPPADFSDTMTKPRTILSNRDSARPTPSLTRIPFTPYQGSVASSAAPAEHSNHAHRYAAKPPTTSSALGSKITAPPWQHTPSNFLDDSSYAHGTLPRLPPPSTIAPPRFDRRASDHSLDHSSQNDLLKVDPLGVLRGQ